MKAYPSQARFPACVLIFPVLFGTGAVLHAGDPLPKPFAPARYEQLAAHSPFSPPTAEIKPQATPPPAPPKVFEKYVLLSLSQEGSEYHATLNNKETSEHIRVRTNSKGEAADGLELASVDWANNPTETKVTLRKGTEFGVVTFDAAGAAPSAPGNIGAQRPGFVPPRAVPAPVFHPPPGIAPNAGVPAPAPGNNNARRPAMIRSAVPATRPVLPGQPGANGVNAGSPVRPPIPGAKPLAGADDDDDDN